MLVEYLRSSDGYYDEHDKWHWKLLAPKLKDNNIIIKKCKDSWSREEVIKLLTDFSFDFAYQNATEPFLNEWIKEKL